MANPRVDLSPNRAPQLACPCTAPSGQQHRQHAKEPGGKGKKNRNLKVGKITVSEKWRESVFRKITNANELKYLDEFLLNKVRPPGGGDWAGEGGAAEPLLPTSFSCEVWIPGSWEDRLWCPCTVPWLLQPTGALQLPEDKWLLRDSSLRQRMEWRFPSAG